MIFHMDSLDVVSLEEQGQELVFGVCHDELTMLSTRLKILSQPVHSH